MTRPAIRLPVLAASRLALRGLVDDAAAALIAILCDPAQAHDALIFFGLLRSDRAAGHI